MKTRKIKTQKQVWVDYLDLLWRKIIHARDNEICQWCHKSNKMDSHHIFGRKNLSVRWDTRNGILLCYSCHQYKIHTDHEGLRMVCINKIGENLYHQLYSLSRNICPSVDFDHWEKMLIVELKQLGITVPTKPRRLTEQSKLPLKSKKKKGKNG